MRMRKVFYRRRRYAARTLAMPITGETILESCLPIQDRQLLETSQRPQRFSQTGSITELATVLEPLTQAQLCHGQQLCHAQQDHYAGLLCPNQAEHCVSELSQTAHDEAQVTLLQILPKIVRRVCVFGTNYSPQDESIIHFLQQQGSCVLDLRCFDALLGCNESYSFIEKAVLNCVNVKPFRYVCAISSILQHIIMTNNILDFSPIVVVCPVFDMRSTKRVLEQTLPIACFFYDATKHEQWPNDVYSNIKTRTFSALPFYSELFLK